MKFYLDDKLLFIDMRQKYTHAACMGDRVICCRNSEAEAREVCENLKKEKQIFIDELLAALVSDELYSGNGYRYANEAKRQHIGDIKTRYRTSADIHNAIARVRASMDSIAVRELTVKA